ncbi:MAG: 3-oxoadipyl-CoA thiolase [Bacteroidota bacterium]
MNATYVIDGIRTAIGRHGGALAPVRTDDLAALVIRELLRRNAGLDAGAIDEVMMGCANQAGEDNRNVARMGLLLAGVPVKVPGETVNMLCASGMAAVINASGAVALGNGEVMIAGGVESMTRAPFVLSKSAQAFGRTMEIFDTSIGWRFVNGKMKQLYGVDSMGETAENVAEMYKIGREDQDLLAYRSQMKASKANEAGRFQREIVSVEIPQGKKAALVFSVDEFIKPETTMEILTKLKPAFRDGGTVTAGNSSGINDGAAALLLASEHGAKKHNLQPIARIVSSAVVGVEPRIMGIGPVGAANLALKRAGLAWDDIDVIELNEAFAAQGLACIREWKLQDDDARINPNGGAIALGHPLGMSGTRLILTAARELQKQKKRYALCTMCIGVGQGYATVIERV